MKKSNVFSVGDMVSNFSYKTGKTELLRVTDVCFDGKRKVYECNDGNLYFPEQLEERRGDNGKKCVK